MKKNEFINIINEVVKEIAIEDTIYTLSEKPSKRENERIKQMHEWYTNLKQGEKDIIEQIAITTVDSCLFGFYNVLDGTRVIEDGGKGKLELYYVNEEKGVRKQLNDMNDGNLLHDIFNAEE